MNSLSEIRQAFATFRVKDHTVPDDTMNWCREACLTMAGISDPAAAIAAAQSALTWALEQAEDWSGYYSGSGDDAEYAAKLHEARAALALLNGQQP